MSATGKSFFWISAIALASSGASLRLRTIEYPVAGWMRFAAAPKAVTGWQFTGSGPPTGMYDHSSSTTLLICVTVKGVCKVLFSCALQSMVLSMHADRTYKGCRSLWHSFACGSILAMMIVFIFPQELAYLYFILNKASNAKSWLASESDNCAVLSYLAGVMYTPGDDPLLLSFACCPTSFLASPAGEPSSYDYIFSAWLSNLLNSCKAFLSFLEQFLHQPGCVTHVLSCCLAVLSLDTPFDTLEVRATCQHIQYR